MTEAKNPGDGAEDDAPGPRRSTYSPPPVEADIPLTLGEEPLEATPTPAPTTPTVPAATPAPPAPATPPPPAPAVPAATALPSNVPPPPVRTSLSDQQIMEQMGHGGNTDQLINALQDQMVLRQKEDDDFDTWATLVRHNFDEETADAAIEAGRRQFDGLPPAPVMEQPPADPAPAQQPVVSETPEALVEQTPSEEIILPRFGGRHASAEPESEPVQPEAPAATTEFERVLGDPDAVSPPTDAWPLVSAEETATATDEVVEQTATEPQFEAVVETEVIVASQSESGEVVAAGVSVQEFLSTKETRQAAFEDVDLQLAPASRFGFDHVGEEPTPANVRVDRALQLFWAWWAVGSPIVAMLLGAWLIETGLSLTQAIIASVAGVLLASLPVVAGTLKGVRTGLPTLVSARAAYGLVGNILPAVLMTVIRIAVASVALWGASWMVSGILVESNYWNGDEAIIAVVIAAVVVFAAVALAVAGRGYIHLTLWISATLATLGLIGVALITLGPVSSQAFSLADAPASTLVAGIATVMSVWLVVWAHFGADLSRFQDPWSPKSSTSLAAVGAVIPPLLLLGWGALLGASGDDFRQGLLGNFFDTVLELAPGWYPIPAVLFLALPLVALGALALHSSGYAVMSLGVKLPRYAAVSIASALAAIATLAAIVFLPNVGDYLIGFSLFLGVVVAAWVGGYFGEIVTRRVYLDPRLLTGASGDFPRWRVAPVLGFVIATAAGWGLIDVEVVGLTWTGYLTNLLSTYTALDLSPWQWGPLVALVVGLAFSGLAGIRGGVTLDRQKAAA